MFEPVHISQVLPCALTDIKRRMEARQDRHDPRDHTRRVLAAVGEFYENLPGKLRSNKPPVGNRQRTLFGT